MSSAIPEGSGRNIAKMSRSKIFLLFIPLLIIAGAINSSAQVSQYVYSDSLQNGWENWSWATVNLSNTAVVQSGTTSASVSSNAAWQAIYFHHAPFSTSGFTGITFWIHGGGGGQLLQVNAVSGGNPLAPYNLQPLTNSWQQVTIPLTALGLGSGSTMEGFWIQDRTGGAQPVYYVDEIGLTGTVQPPTTSVVVNIDPDSNRHAISPLIYGVAFASTAQLIDLNATLNRYGGNAATRYNWQINADNRANDWYYESIAGANQPGEIADTFVQNTKLSAAQPMLTVPIIDWIAKVGPNREKLASFSIARYGAQTGNDWQWFPDAGNGVRTNGTFVTGNDKNDANTPNSVALQQNWVQHLISRWGTSQNGGVRWYFLDNEHTIWFATHRDVAPVGMTMDELFTRMRDYGAMVKSQDPNAIVLGPEEWGWNGYLYSGFDLQWAPDHGYTYPDRAAHGNMDYSAWLLQQFRNYDQANGRRILDYFTLHIYPQGGESGDDVSTAMQQKRNRSTRSLWDPNYVDESWINNTVKLIPRMRGWVGQYYPNTKIGITEYNWGAENHINGATAQADLLGIFGREGVDLATRWTTPDISSPTYKAFKLFRNYDGQNSGFGDVSVSASVPNPDEVAAFAALRTNGGALTAVVINKLTNAVSTTVNIGNFATGPTAQVWQLTASNQINRLADVAVSAGAINISLPAQSITLIVVAPNSIASPTNLTATKTGTAVSLVWNDNSADEDGFVIERSRDGGPFAEVLRTGPNTNRYRAHFKAGSFTYRIRTLRSGAVSVPSNEVSVRR